MNDSARQWLARACHRLLRPLVRILLRHGIAYRDFSEIVRSVYAEVARESFTPQGRRPTDAHVAVITGLTRKDVKRLREQADHDYSDDVWGGANRATRVLSGWHRDPDFTDAHGAPKALALDDETTGFTALVRRYSGDIPANAILEELERVMAVSRSAEDNIEVIQRAYVPDAGDAESLRMLGSASHDLLATLEHNLSRPDGAHPYFQRTVFNTRVDVRALPIFHRLVSQHGQQLLETLDDWLEHHEVAAQDKDKPVKRTGVGIYYFEDATHPEESDDNDG
ncbi:DUF6502 family protein [Salinisphaera aquimarina]|uniref:DUF6502 family protein n=1 Tax=Salinisphaera aquimarina TaxID=2094031 RepID=A0ABV7EPY4_9GAMM